MTTRITRPVIKRCPYRDEIDSGELTITFPGHAPELHDLAQAVETLAGLAISHEEFTAGVAEIVAERTREAGVAPGARVTTTWHTGPWTVEVESTAGGE